jgi:hypothetical protein
LQDRPLSIYRLWLRFGLWAGGLADAALARLRLQAEHVGKQKGEEQGNAGNLSHSL